MQNSDFSTGVASLYGSQPSSVVFACKTATLAPELQVSMGPSPHLWFLHAKQRLLDQNYKSPRVPDPTCRFCMQNNVIITRITSLYGPQTSPTVFCIQNSDFRTRITSLYGPQTSPTVFCIQNSDFSTGVASLYGSQPSSVVFACKTATLAPEILVSMGPSLNLSFVACTTTWLASELRVSMGRNHHLWFLHAKQRLLDQNYKSLWVPDFACWFVNA